MRTPLVSGVLAVLFVACGPAQSSAHGQANYVAPPPQGGQKVQPQSSSSDLKLTVGVEGTANFDRVVSTACSLTSGSIHDSVSTSGSISGDGSYAGAFANESSSTTATSPLCGSLKNVKLQSLTSVTLQASIPNNAANCDGYCQAQATVSCGSSNSSCIASAKASCVTDCTAPSHTRITGHGQVSQSDLATANGKLGDSGQIDANADLTFDSVE